MRHLIIVSLLLLMSIPATRGQAGFKKNSIQIGRSGYYFGDNSFKIGELGGITNHGFYTYTPYLAYSRLQFKHLGLRVSIEKYQVGYFKGRTFPDPFIVFGRNFSQFQIDALGYATLWKKLTFFGTINFAKRYNGEELFVESIYDHGTWIEGRIGFNDINGWGVGTGLEMKYNFYKKLSISFKGNYLKFKDKPKKQYGLNLAIGYDF